MADRNTPQTDIAAWTTDRSPVRRSAGSLTAYHPTVRDRIARWLLGDDPSDFRRGLAVGTVGSAGLGSEQFSLADITPVGTAFGADKAAHALEDGNYRNAGTAALPDTLQEAESLAMRAEHPSARFQRPFEMGYLDGVAANRFPDTAADDADWTIPATAELRDYLVDRGELALDVKDPNGGRQRPLSTRERIDYILNDSWPAQAVKSAWSGFTLPGDVWAGKVDPMSEEGLNRAFETAGMAVTGNFASNVLRKPRRLVAAMKEVEHDPPKYPQRPFEADYPNGAIADEAGRLQLDMEGRPLIARYRAGRLEAGQPDTPLGGYDDLAKLVEELTGEAPAFLPRSEIVDHGHTYFWEKTGEPAGVALADDLHPADIPRVLAHESGHVVDLLAGKIPTEGLEPELVRIYDTLITGRENNLIPTTPEVVGYSSAEALREYMAEALRAYFGNPNYIKSVGPRTAARIREYVNDHPRLKHVIQLNGVPAGLIGAGMMSDEEFMKPGGEGKARD